MGVEPKIGVPQNGWFIMEILIKMGFWWENPPIFGHIHIPLAFGTCESDPFSDPTVGV